MYIHYFFFALYLVGLARSADKFHAILKTISNLRSLERNPKSNKEKIWKDLDKAKMKLKSIKLKSFLVLTCICVIHLVGSLIVSSFFSLYNLGLSQYHWTYPFPALVLSFLILLVIFWLKGKGGGVPNSKALREFGGTNWGK